MFSFMYGLEYDDCIWSNDIGFHFDVFRVAGKYEVLVSQGQMRSHVMLGLGQRYWSLMYQTHVSLQICPGRLQIYIFCDLLSSPPSQPPHLSPHVVSITLLITSHLSSHLAFYHLVKLILDLLD